MPKCILVLLLSVSAFAESFLDLYVCDSHWESINGRNGYRILDCNAQQVKNSESCTGTNYICLGIVRCTPIPGVQFPEGLDPDFISGPVEYMAGCHSKNASDCKAPVECMKESMEKSILNGDVQVSRQEQTLKSKRRGSR